MKAANEMDTAAAKADPNEKTERDTTLKEDGVMRKEAREVMMGHERVIMGVLCSVGELIGKSKGVKSGKNKGSQGDCRTPGRDKPPAVLVFTLGSDIMHSDTNVRPAVEAKEKFAAIKDAPKAFATVTKILRFCIGCYGHRQPHGRHTSAAPCAPICPTLFRKARWKRACKCRPRRLSVSIFKTHLSRFSYSGIMGACWTRGAEVERAYAGGRRNNPPVEYF